MHEIKFKPTVTAVLFITFLVWFSMQISLEKCVKQNSPSPQGPQLPSNVNMDLWLFSWTWALNLSQVFAHTSCLCIAYILLIYNSFHLSVLIVIPALGITCIVALWIFIQIKYNLYSSQAVFTNSKFKLCIFPQIMLAIGPCPVDSESSISLLHMKWSILSS